MNIRYKAIWEINLLMCSALWSTLLFYFALMPDDFTCVVKGKVMSNVNGLIVPAKNVIIGIYTDNDSVSVNSSGEELGNNAAYICWKQWNKHVEKVTALEKPSLD